MPSYFSGISKSHPNCMCQNLLFAIGSNLYKSNTLFQILKSPLNRQYVSCSPLTLIAGALFSSFLTVILKKNVFVMISKPLMI